MPYDARRPGDEWDVPHELEGPQTRLRPVEVIPLAEQADARRPRFHIPIIFQPPARPCATRRGWVDANPQRRERIADQLCAGEAPPERLHQPLDVGLFQVDQDGLGQEEEGLACLAAQDNVCQAGSAAVRIVPGMENVIFSL